MSTLAEIQNRIAIVRRKERNVVLLSGLCKSVLALVFVVLAYLLIDWIFDLPYIARLVCAAIGTGVLGWILNKHLLRELRRIHDDDEIALRIETRNPDLRNRLISTLQLTRMGKTEYTGSPELLAALEEETVRMSDPLDFSKIVNTEMLIRFGIAAALVVAIKLALIARFPGYFEALGARLVHASATYPTRTRIQALNVPDYVPRGEDVHVEVLLDKTGVLTFDQPGQLNFRSVAKGNNVPIELQEVEKGRFTGMLTKAVEDVDVIASIGDARSLPKRIRVLARPEVDVAASGRCVQYQWPEYTHIKNLQAEKFGGLSALAGSTASIKFVATKMIKSGSIERADGHSFPLEKKLENIEVTEDGKKVQKQIQWLSILNFPIDKGGSFHVHLEDTDGLTNIQPPVEYPIDAKPDLPPTIKLLRPRKDITVTPTARINVSFQARDDYGLRVIWLVYRLQADGQAEGTGKVERIERKVEPENGKLPTELSKPFAWDLSALKLGDRSLLPGDQIVFWFEADDECTTNDFPVAAHGRKPIDPGVETPEIKGPVYPRSSDVKLSVISREEKARELQAEVERLTLALEHHKDNQEELKEKVLLLLEELKKVK